MCSSYTEFLLSCQWFFPFLGTLVQTSRSPWALCALPIDFCHGLFSFDSNGWLLRNRRVTCKKSWFYLLSSFCTKPNSLFGMPENTQESQVWWLLTDQVWWLLTHLVELDRCHRCAFLEEQTADCDSCAFLLTSQGGGGGGKSIQKKKKYGRSLVLLCPPIYLFIIWFEPRKIYIEFNLW